MIVETCKCKFLSLSKIVKDKHHDLKKGGNE